MLDGSYLDLATTRWRSVSTVTSLFEIGTAERTQRDGKVFG